ncbi:MAG: D-glycero-beta-D-manno-heptose 1,7-bisphosphate 7-phosphatase [bacterium]
MNSTDSPLRQMLLLDRDGTLNVEVDYLANSEELELLPGAVESIRRAHELGWVVAVVTNQSGLVHGYFDQEDLDSVHSRLKKLIEDGGEKLDGIYVCPHSPTDGCECRKPKPGLLIQAAEELHGDLSKSVMVGDKTADLSAGLAAGTHAVLVRTGYGRDTEREGNHGAEAVINDLRGLPALLERWNAERFETRD